MKRSRAISLAAVRSAIPGPRGEHASSAFRRGTLEVKLSAPRAPNVQSPHAQDEIYVVDQDGSGEPEALTPLPDELEREAHAVAAGRARARGGRRA